MTRVAYVVSEYPAPSHTFIRREVAVLREMGLDIVAFSVRETDPKADGPLDSEERLRTTAILGRPASRFATAMLAEFAGSPIRFLSTLRLAWRHRVPGARPALWSFFHFLEALVLARLVRQRGAERIHSHFANSGATVGMLAAHHLGMPWSLTLHGISETDYPAGALLADKVRRASFVACASWFMRAQAMRMVDPVHWEKLRIVRCAIDLECLPRVPDRSTDRRVTLICVGRLSAEKGHAGLLEALKSVLDRGMDAELHLVGDGPLLETLTNRVAELGLASRVHLLGRLAEAETLAAIARSDALVLPSLMEGLPVVLIEAMAMGKPVLTSWVAGIPELVASGETGILFAPGDWDALAKGMAALVGDAPMRRRLGSAAAIRVREEFDIHRAVVPLADAFAPSAATARGKGSAAEPLRPCSPEPAGIFGEQPCVRGPFPPRPARS